MKKKKWKKKNEPNIYILSWDMDSINLSPSKSTIKIEDKKSLFNDKINGFVSEQEFELFSESIPFNMTSNY